EEQVLLAVIHEGRIALDAPLRDETQPEPRVGGPPEIEAHALVDVPPERAAREPVGTHAPDQVRGGAARAVAGSVGEGERNTGEPRDEGGLGESLALPGAQREPSR